jgi:hypothetical protein
MGIRELGLETSEGTFTHAMAVYHVEHMTPDEGRTSPDMVRDGWAAIPSI